MKVRVTLEELLTALAAAGVGSLHTDIERTADGKYVLPVEAITALLAGTSSGTIVARGDAEGHATIANKAVSDVVLTTQTGSSATSYSAAVTVTAAQVWHVLAIVASMAADSNAANRNFRLTVGLDGFTLATGIAAGNKLLIERAHTVTADQDAILSVMGGTYFTNISGTETEYSEEVAGGQYAMKLKDLYLYGGCNIITDISANGQTGDLLGLSVLYRRVA